MNELEIKHFKALLSDYRYLLLKIYRVKLMQEELDVKRGIKSVSMDVEHTSGSTDPLWKALKMLDDVEKADFLERQLLKYQSQLNIIMKFLKDSEMGESIKAIYCTKESTYVKEAAKLYMDERTLRRKVNNEISNYVKNCPLGTY